MGCRSAGPRVSLLLQPLPLQPFPAVHLLLLNPDIFEADLTLFLNYPSGEHSAADSPSPFLPILILRLEDRREIVTRR